MMNPKRLEEIFRLRFLHKIAFYLKPASHQFSDAPYTEAHCKISQAISMMIHTLITSSEGVRFLLETRLFHDIADSLYQLVDPVLGPLKQDLVFSKQKMEDTLTCHYFTFIGILTESADGNKIMEASKMYNILFRLLYLRGRTDIVMAILSSLNYAKLISLI